MEKRKRTAVLTVCAAALAISAAAFIYTLAFNRAFLTQAFLILFFSVIISEIVVLSERLSVSLRESLYQYKNILFVGGILFSVIMAAALASNFIPCFFTKDITLHEVYYILIGFPRTFSYYAVFVMTALCLLLGISNISLMKHEGFRPKNALSILVAVLYIGGTFAVYFLSDFLHSGIMPQTSALVWADTAIPLFLLLMLCYFECVLAGSAVMGYMAARQKPAYDKDYIIILGCSIDKKGGLLPLLKGRVNRAIRFAWEQEIAVGKPLKYVPSGGKGPDEIMSEGSAMELYLMTKGAESDEIFPEKESRTTYENMTFSKRIIDGLNENAKIAFATTNYHMLRSGIIARSAGIDAEGIAGDTKWYFWPNGFIREFFGILKMNIKVHACVAYIMAFFSIAAAFVNASII